MTTESKYTMLWEMRLLDYLKNREQKRLGEERFILALDGGGMRGIISATILAHLERLLLSMGERRPLYSHFDLISGTSTGGLIALALSNPIKEDSLISKNENSGKSFKGDPGPSIEQIASLYLDYGQTIFPKNQSLFQLNVIGQLFSQKYDDRPFSDILYHIFHNTTLAEALTPSMVVTYDITNNRPYILSSYDTPTLFTRVAARATSAAPTYFSPVPIGKEPLYLVDGGVVANNPVLYAYKEAKKLYPDAKRFHILSISTASSDFSISVERSNAGVVGWLDPAKGTPIYRLYASSQMQTSNEIASALEDLHYVRVDGTLDQKVRLDETDPQVLTMLVERANQIYLDHLEEISQFCALLLDRKKHPVRPTLLSQRVDDKDQLSS